MLNSERMVEKVLETAKCSEIIYKGNIIFEYPKIVEALLNKKKTEKLQGEFCLDRVVVTSGGFETRIGFQYSLLGAMGDSRIKRIEYEGDHYPIRLNKDEFISELIFIYSYGKEKYEVKIVSDSVKVSPKPPPYFLNCFVKVLKDALTFPQRIFALSAREKLKSAKINFIACRYRSAAHDVYYALHNIVQSQLCNSGENPRFRHGSTDKILSKNLCVIKHTIGFDSLDGERYSRLGQKAYELRELADYESAFEAGNSLENLSEIILKTQELLNLTLYKLDGSIVTSDGKLCLLPGEVEYEKTCPEDISERQSADKIQFLQSGLILAENFSTRQFLLRLMQQKGLYFTDIIPDFETIIYAQCGDDKYRYSFVKKTLKEGFIPLTGKTARKWSAVIRNKKMAELRLSSQNVDQEFAFFYRGYFFKLHILTDGRFYIFLSVNENKIDEQIAVLGFLRKRICRAISRNLSEAWNILFSTVNIIEKSKTPFSSRQRVQRGRYNATVFVESEKRSFEMGVRYVKAVE